MFYVKDFDYITRDDEHIIMDTDVNYFDTLEEAKEALFSVMNKPAFDEQNVVESLDQNGYYSHVTYESEYVITRYQDKYSLDRVYFTEEDTETGLSDDMQLSCGVFNSIDDVFSQIALSEFFLKNQSEF